MDTLTPEILIDKYGFKELPLNYAYMLGKFFIEMKGNTFYHNGIRILTEEELKGRYEEFIGKELTTK